MIRSWKDRETEKLARREYSKRFAAIEKAARLRLERIAAAVSLGDIAAIPGHRFEKLAGDRAGQYSIRINDRYRVCFRWKDGAAEDVEVVDYHE